MPLFFPRTRMPPSHYETSDVYLASFLLCKGATLLGYRRPSLRRVVFRFHADEELHWWLHLYQGNAPLAIVPRALFGSLRGLKSHIRRRPTRPTFPSPLTC